MNNKIQQNFFSIICLIFIIIIKYNDNEFKETLIASYSTDLTEQEEENNILSLNLLYS